MNDSNNISDTENDIHVQYKEESKILLNERHEIEFPALKKDSEIKFKERNIHFSKEFGNSSKI